MVRFKDISNNYYVKIRGGLTMLHGCRSGVPTVLGFGSDGDWFWEEAHDGDGIIGRSWWWD